ncbi:ABC transporter permease [uncultured Clostridium sp.]|uniref:ABC transporter permease n=1 Tax=uncultured Clostridium sp. TaxID=59620 RepID=UPI002606EC81|nr:ABC transporter permease [uncultured Clostridium sp.]
MNFKLAFKNVKKSMKNYAIYFLTLSFAVCIFYAFNSIGAQGKLLSANGDKEIIEMMGQVIGYISVFVSVVLGCLIIYANNFLIKRRKKELGLYMSLGMQKGKISKMLVVEEIIIGIASLVCGILSGIVLSQFLALLTVKLFNISDKSFSVIFSLDAMIKSIIYFGIIFILVMIFNVIIVSKYKLIDLLTAHKKNEKMKVKNPIVAGGIFVASLIIIGVAYKFILETGLNVQDVRFKLSILFGVVGTILFFYGLTGFVILIISKIKGIYYKKLNVFTVRQMNSKINTNFISMAVISLMLFITISLIAVSVGFKMQNIDQFTPYSATISASESGVSLEQGLKDAGFELPQGSKVEYTTTKTIDNVTYQSEFSKYADSTLKSSYLWKSYNGQPSKIDFMSITDYNKLLSLSGKNPITLGADQVLLTSDTQYMTKTLDNFFNENGKIKIGDKEYTTKDNKAVSDNLATSQGATNFLTVIVNNSVLSNAKIDYQYANINYDKNNATNSEAYMQKFFNNKEYKSIGNSNNSDMFALLSTKESMIQSQGQMTTMMLYIGLYIGAIFLVASAAVLALQQLSEASDSYDRYVALRKIGASNKQINKSIFIQTLSYFALPLILGLVHASIGIYVANELISNFGKSSILQTSIITMGVIAFIYFGYFLVTFLGYKNIVKEK